MSRQVLTSSSLIVATFLGLVASTAQAQYEPLIRWVPDNANTLVIFDVQHAMNSPMAKAGGWKEKRLAAFTDGMVTLPPDTTRFVLATQFDFEYMQPAWDLALLELNHEPSMAKVARDHKGAIDQIGQYESVRLPSDAYVIKFDDRRVGAMAPANRQSVGRWIGASSTKRNISVSPYLKEAVGFVQKVGTPIVMAMDLSYAISSTEAEARLLKSETLKQFQADPKLIGSVLASMRGITLGVTLKEKAYGKIKIDFSNNATPLAKLAKPLLLEVLGNRGAMIEDFQNWNVQVTDKQITLSGYFTESGLRRVFSLCDIPAQVSKESAPISPEEAARIETHEKHARTIAYYQAIDSLMADILSKRGATHLNQYGVWYESYAKKIERLPILGVDKDLLDYGDYCINGLRQASAAVKARGMNVHKRTVDAMANRHIQTGETRAVAGGYGGGRWGRHGGHWTAVSHYQWNPTTIRQEDLAKQARIGTQIRTQEKVDMAYNVQAIIGQMKQSRNNVRRMMTDRYKLDF